MIIMPIYSYFCEKCEEIFEVFHMMSEACTKCDLCEASGSVIKVPSTIASFKFIDSNAPGKVVKEFIKNSKQDLKEEKKLLKTQEYK